MPAPVVPTLSQIREYLDVSTALLSDEMLQDIIDAEVEDQAEKCYVDPYKETLRQAIFRRVLRATALRGVPLGIIGGAGDGNTGVSRVNGADREVQRLEARWRRVSGSIG